MHNMAGGDDDDQYSPSDTGQDIGEGREDGAARCRGVGLWERRRAGDRKHFEVGRGWVNDGEENWEKEREWARIQSIKEGWRRKGGYEEDEVQRRFFYNCQSAFSSSGVEQIAKWDARRACKRVEKEILQLQLQLKEGGCGCNRAQ